MPLRRQEPANKFLSEAARPNSIFLGGSVMHAICDLSYELLYCKIDGGEGGTEGSFHKSIML
jgi:hypothetical protein